MGGAGRFWGGGSSVDGYELLLEIPEVYDKGAACNFLKRRWMCDEEACGWSYRWGVCESSFALDRYVPLWHATWMKVSHVSPKRGHISLRYSLRHQHVTARDLYVEAMYVRYLGSLCLLQPTIAGLPGGKKSPDRPQCCKPPSKIPPPPQWPPPPPSPTAAPPSEPRQQPRANQPAPSCQGQKCK